MEDIICPKCDDVLKPRDSWDFMDGEKHKISCCCGYKFIVLIERPVEYFILELAK